jgi:hypothetical protein
MAAAHPQNPDQKAKGAEKSRKWRQKNKERSHAYMKAWRAAKRERIHARQRARRAASAVHSGRFNQDVKGGPTGYRMAVLPQLRARNTIVIAIWPQRHLERKARFDRRGGNHQRSIMSFGNLRCDVQAKPKSLRTVSNISAEKRMEQSVHCLRRNRIPSIDNAYFQLFTRRARQKLDGCVSSTVR